MCKGIIIDCALEQSEGFFLKSVGNFIVTKLDLFRKGSFLLKDAVAITIMENFTGQDGFPATEENQSFHTDYPVDPSK